MLDPSLTVLLDHLNWSPPAIVQPAPSSATDQKMAAYADYVTRQEEQLAAWVEHGVRLRAELWTSAIEGRSGLDHGTLSKIIEQFEEGLKREAFVLVKKEKQARRDEKDLSGPLRVFVERQHSRWLTAARHFYREGRDFASFLRALRAELDPESRVGTSFEDAAALEKNLLKSLA